MAYPNMWREVAAEYNVSPKYSVLIACIDKKTIKTIFSDWPWLNLGLELSKRLLELPKGERAKRVPDLVYNIVSEVDSDRLVVDNIDILFSPAYKLDVLKLFTQIGRSKKLIVIWDGELNDGILSYSAQGYEDYQCYNINDYDVYCITK